MTFSKEKGLYRLKIDKEFKELIRPLFKNEYLQLESNLISDGCREPISVWNDFIIDGHNRYRICCEHSIPFAVEELSFSCREEVIAWICANQLGRRNLTEESRKFLIGKQYESEKILTRKRGMYQNANCNEDNQELPYEEYNPAEKPQVTDTKHKTAAKIATENHISHGTVEKYSLYARAIEAIEKKVPQMARKILSGRYKISHEGVLSLSKKSAEEIQELNQRLEQAQYPFARYQATRQEIQGSPRAPKVSVNAKPSIKDMPKYDPDAEVTGLTLTIPSWSSSIDRIIHSDLDSISDSARKKLHKVLIDLQNTVSLMLSLIKEES